MAEGKQPSHLALESFGRNTTVIRHLLKENRESSACRGERFILTLLAHLFADCLKKFFCRRLAGRSHGAFDRAPSSLGHKFRKKPVAAHCSLAVSKQGVKPEKAGCKPTPQGHRAVIPPTPSPPAPNRAPPSSAIPPPPAPA